MNNLIELSVEILEMLKENGYNSVIHVSEEDVNKEWDPLEESYHILIPSVEFID